MSRPYHGRRRRRPRNRRRYRGSGLPGRPLSYQAFGPFRWFYDLLIPGVRGRNRRGFFNGVSSALAVYFGLLGAAFGWGMAGPLGVLFGWCVGFTVAAGLFGRSGHYRP